MTELRQAIRFCRSRDGTCIAYAKTGSGPPLVKAANWLSHLEHDLNSPVWRHWIAELSRRHALLRYDERGCGLSDWDADLSLDLWADDLASVVDAAGLERFALFGISQGAAIAVTYAVRYPDRVSHLVLLNGYARGRSRRGDGPVEQEKAQMMLRLAEIGWGQENAAFRQFFTTLFIPGGTQEQHRWFNELERISTSPRNAARFMRVLYDIDVVDLLPRVACPTLVLHSAGDVAVPFAEGRLVAGAIPGARFVPLASANHVLLDSEPAWQRFLEEVDAFLPGAVPSAAPVRREFLALTPRERELLGLIAQGRDNAQIAATLGLAEKTVRNHVSSIFAKLEVENRGQAIVLARTHGFGG